MKREVPFVPREKSPQGFSGSRDSRAAGVQDVNEELARVFLTQTTTRNPWGRANDHKNAQEDTKEKPPSPRFGNDIRDSHKHAYIKKEPVEQHNNYGQFVNESFNNVPYNESEIKVEKDQQPSNQESTSTEGTSSNDKGSKPSQEHSGQQASGPLDNTNASKNLFCQAIIAVRKEIADILRIVSAIVYPIIRYLIIGVITLYVGGIIPLHLAAHIIPGPTCGFITPYTPESLSTFSPCSDPKGYIQREPDPLFAQAVTRSSSFAKLQKVNSDTDKLPAQISETRHDFRKLLMELRVGPADAGSMSNLYSLVPEYNVLLDKVVDGMHDCRAKTRSLVDNTITYTDWTNSALRRIDGQNSSITALIYYRRWWPYQKSFAEMAVEKVFDEFADKIEDLAGGVYSKYVELGKTLRELEQKLDSIAIALNAGKDTFEKAKLAEKSFWLKLIRSQPYRQKMEDIERKAGLCADFYASAMKALKIIDATTLELSEARIGIRHLREEVGKATLPRGKEWSIKLTIRLLENSAAELLASKSYRSIGYW
ncbi:hypothetical protein TWF481_007823 [Arthrobotrys musiformis]|uniref:Uncharacterized protein n=1 Tax=Arthrobotrys musiformis TaxID=47236 RepID=A0AAV9W6P6_9PEZI